ncbi:MAG: hypothetical protein HQK87_03055 [Nitrospinae bacterium]|nr:hypothetical protein [Nitrospinota bacterium]
MEQPNKKLGFIIILVITLLFIYVVYKASDDFRLGAISLVGTASLAIYAHYTAREREAKARHYADKREVYEQFFAIMFHYLENARKGNTGQDSEIDISELFTFKKKLLIWGSAEVINSWLNYEISARPSDNNQSVFPAIEKVIRAMRNDLGHDDSILESGSLLSLIIVAEERATFMQHFHRNQDSN